MDIDNYIRNLSTEELLNVLTSDQKETIYDAVNYELKKEDVLSLLEDREDIPNVLKDAIACDVAEMWKNGYYDCNLSYWDNINNLIEDSIRKKSLLSEENTKTLADTYMKHRWLLKHYILTDRIQTVLIMRLIILKRHGKLSIMVTTHQLRLSLLQMN